MSFMEVAKEILVAEIQEQANNVHKVLTKSVLSQCDPGKLKRIRRSLSDIYEEIHE